MATDVVHHATTQKLAENRLKAKEHREHMRRFNEQIPKTEIRASRLQRDFIVMTLLKCLSIAEI